LSRFQKAIYYKVFKEPLRRYLLKKKERPLWKPRQFKQQLIIWLSILLFALGLVLIMVLFDRDNDSSMYLAVGYVIAVPFMALFFSMDKWGKSRKNRIHVPLCDFVGGSNRLCDISKVYVRAIRHVLGYIYKLDPCQIHSADTPEKLAYIARASSPPFAFELILGTATRMSIPLNDEDVDQITENICNCPDVETLIIKISKELEKRRGRNCQNAIDLKQESPKDKKEALKYIFIGCVLGGLGSIEIFFNEHDFSAFSIIIRIICFITIGGLAGWGIVKLENWEPKKSCEESERLLKQLISLSNNVVGKYLYYLLVPMSVGEVITIKESEPLPECKEGEFERVPLFSEICVFLKSAIEVEDSFYERPIKGELVSRVKDEQPENRLYNHTVTICDGIEDAYVTFQRNNVKQIANQGISL
jgi:hypothetical protein